MFHVVCCMSDSGAILRDACSLDGAPRIQCNYQTIPSTCIWGEHPRRFSPFNGRDVLLRVHVLIQNSLRKRRLFFVFKAGDETSGHANHAGIATADGYDFDFGFGQAVEAIDNLVYQIISKGEGRFQRHKRVFGFLEPGADFFFGGESLRRSLLARKWAKISAVSNFQNLSSFVLGFRA